MSPLRDTPIKRKLMLVIMLTTGFALLLMASAVVTYEVVTFRSSMMATTTGLAKVVGSMSTSSVAFNNQEDAQEVLAALAVEPQITLVAIYDKNGRLFASFTPGGSVKDLPITPEPDGRDFRESHLVMFTPIIEKDVRLGTLYIRADLREMYQRLFAYGALVSLVGVGAIGVSMGVSIVLQRRITGPIVDLAATARAVSERQDYSVRAVAQGRDEIGDLTDAFNQMLIRVGDANAALQQAKDVAEAANRAKDEFLAILSHELRTPLTPVLATVAMLREAADTSPALLQELDTIQRNVQLEARLIDDLLDLTRISRGKLELHQAVVDVRALLAHAVRNYLIDQATEKNLKVEVKVAETAATHIVGDAPRITQVLWNLLQNACKFTPAGGTITIRAFNDSASSGPPPALIVEITDTGIGIDPAVLPRIFTAFDQGERSRTRLFGGLGLGLAISLAITEKHGGTLTASSPGTGQGATFTLRLPTVPASTAEATAPAAPAVPVQPAEAHAGRILLVEDHADSARQLTRLLMREGHEVTGAAAVAEAMQLADKHTFDLLVSDLGLPDGSGIDLMRHLAAHHPMPGIALSGYGMEEDVKASLAAGFQLHLTKPVDWPDLKAAIQRLLDEKQHRSAGRFGPA
ncbi:ATP-binding protein [Prosthecobacter sp.]|uniref:ATP-binding response regulator n=1 Tax=Prosthecobacter sp. TaxID=1965333 RepID=UPI002AB9EF30|nr:ATP-binding protein [Prosthecobacter sp.]MDZ4401167.1 ATP-binding protein [Prosthecobacter sp.]